MRQIVERKDERCFNASFALETEALMAKGQNGVVVLYVILSLSCGILAVSAAEHIV